MHSSITLSMTTGTSAKSGGNSDTVDNESPGQLCSPAWKNSVSFLLDDRNDRSSSYSNSIDCCARFVTRFEPEMKALRQRCPPQAVLILTPVVPHPPTNMGGNMVGDTTMDPFEPLGRAIADRHDKTVFHVPYVPAVGLTSKHEVFLRQVGAIIVVVCEPAKFSATEFSMKSQLSSACQHAFSGNVVNFLKAEYEEMSETQRPIRNACGIPDKAIPTPLLVYISSKLSPREEQGYAVEMRSRGFQNVIHADCYTPRALCTVSDLIFD